MVWVAVVVVVATVVLAPGRSAARTLLAVGFVRMSHAACSMEEMCSRSTDGKCRCRKLR